MSMQPMRQGRVKSINFTGVQAGASMDPAVKRDEMFSDGERESSPFHKVLTSHGYKYDGYISGKTGHGGRAEHYSHLAHTAVVRHEGGKPVSVTHIKGPGFGGITDHTSPEALHEHLTKLHGPAKMSAGKPEATFSDGPPHHFKPVLKKHGYKFVGITGGALSTYAHPDGHVAHVLGTHNYAAVSHRHGKTKKETITNNPNKLHEHLKKLHGK